MFDRLLMTPGPTYISEKVRNSMIQPITNPDLDIEFYEYYKTTTNKLAQLMNTENKVIILSGEGILGLEAACASLIENGDRILCIDNGIFGKGFGDFVKIYGGECVYFKGDYRKSIDIEALKTFLENDNNFKFATIVHCETPSGLINPIKDICPLLNSYGILTVVDAVSSIGGIDIKTDEWNIDILLGGSQKCLSAPPGLTFLSISEVAWEIILNRKKQIIGYYCNLSLWKKWYENKWFPYTQPISDIYALNKAVDIILKDNNKFIRHSIIAEATRNSLIEAGLELYPLSGYSDTVTAFLIPQGINDKEFREYLIKKYNLIIAGAFAELEGKVFRIGHMGENCKEEKVYITLKYLNNALIKHNIRLKTNLHESFIRLIGNY